MFIMIALEIGVGMAAAGSLFLMRTTFRTIEKILYYMVIVVAQEHLHSMISDNLNLLEITKSAAAFTIFKINQLLLFPALALWLLYSFFHPRCPIVAKIVLTAGWLGAMYGLYLLMDKQDVFRFTGWNWRYLISVRLGVLALSLAFSLWFRWLLRKRERDAAVA